MKGIYIETISARSNEYGRLKCANKVTMIFLATSKSGFCLAKIARNPSGTI